MTTITETLVQGDIHYNPEDDSGQLELSFPEQKNIKYTVDVRFGELENSVHHAHNLSEEGEGFIIEQPKSLKLYFSGNDERRSLIETLEGILNQLKKIDDVTYISNDIFHNSKLTLYEATLLTHIIMISKTKKIVKEGVEEYIQERFPNQISKNNFNQMWNNLVNLGFLNLTTENDSNTEIWKVTQFPA